MGRNGAWTTAGSGLPGESTFQKIEGPSHSPQKLSETDRCSLRVVQS